MLYPMLYINFNQSQAPHTYPVQISWQTRSDPFDIFASNTDQIKTAPPPLLEMSYCHYMHVTRCYKMLQDVTSIELLKRNLNEDTTQR